MKRIIPGLLAAVIAIGAVAFKAPKSPKLQDTHTFYYVAPDNSYDEPDVENKANWTSNPATVPTCSGSSRACQIEVDDAYTQVVGGQVVFRTSGMVANIDAVNTSGSNYVPTTGGSSVGIAAKTDRP